MDPYRAYKIKSSLLYVFGTLALGIAVVMIGFMVHILSLRSEYRSFCLEINDAVLASPAGSSSISRDGESAPLTDAALNYYDVFLLDEGTLVYNRRAAEPTDRSITISLPRKTLTFTPLDEGTAVNLRWETPEGVRSYSVRAAYITFEQLSSYLDTYLRTAPPPG